MKALGAWLVRLLTALIFLNIAALAAKVAVDSCLPDRGSRVLAVNTPPHFICAQLIAEDKRARKVVSSQRFEAVEDRFIYPEFYQALSQLSSPTVLLSDVPQDGRKTKLLVVSLLFISFAISLLWTIVAETLQLTAEEPRIPPHTAVVPRRERSAAVLRILEDPEGWNSRR